MLLQFPKVLPHKWQFLCHHPVENDPQAPNIDLWAMIGLELQDLRGHIGGDATEGVVYGLEIPYRSQSVLFGYLAHCPEVYSLLAGPGARLSSGDSTALLI